MKRILIVCILMFTIQTTFSQTLFKDGFKRVSFDLYAGFPSFHGDIKNNFGYKVSTKLNFHLTSAFSFYADVSFGSLKGINEELNNSFTNNIVKTMIGGEAYLFNILRFNSLSTRIQPFIGIGAGGLKSSISESTIIGQEPSALYKDWTFIFMYTGGLKIKLSESFDANIKFNINFTKSDFLDNYKPNVIANKRNDSYNEYLIGITYHFGKKMDNPIVWNEAESPMFSSVFNTKKTSKNSTTDNEQKEAEKEKATAPVYSDPNATESEDLDSNEYDCIPKY